MDESQTEPTTRAVHVEHCMGTVFSIDVRDPGTWQDAIGDVVSWLHHVDAVFSLYRTDSTMSRIRSGALRVRDAGPEVAEVLDLCADVQLETGGYFTALHDRTIDPTGLVKGWAVERAADILRGHGSVDHAINGGGDVQLAGEAAPGQPWRVGIVDPHDGARTVTVVTGRDVAVATSGTAERGRHIRDPFSGRPSAEYVSATVVGPSLTRADAYATAAFVMGDAALGWVHSQPGYEVLLVAADGAVRTSAGWQARTQG